MRIAIIGMGYTGGAVAQELIAQGHEVVGIARRVLPLTTFREQLGTSFIPCPADTQNVKELAEALDGAHRVIHLAPPSRHQPVYEDAARVGESLWKNCERLVYGSTTGVYSPPTDPNEWITENSPIAPMSMLGRLRAEYERALEDTSPVSTYVVRIAGIYGPKRHLIKRLETGRLELFDNGPRVSRIHQRDLARILVAMILHSHPPSCIIACDERPVPTLEVALYASSLAQVELPELRPQAEALLTDNPILRDFRKTSKPCKSLHREQLIGELCYPSYREGMYESLLEDGYITAET